MTVIWGCGMAIGIFKSSPGDSSVPRLKTTALDSIHFIWKHTDLHRILKSNLGQ